MRDCPVCPASCALFDATVDRNAPCELLCQKTGVSPPDPKPPVMFGVSTSLRNPVFWAQEYGAQHRAIFVPDMARSPAGIAKSVIIPALAAQKST